MYASHPNFTPPASDQIIWRYFDFPKFVAMLDEKALYFSQAERLRDPYEGAYPAATHEAMRKELERRLATTAVENAMRAFSDVNEQMPLLTYVNCWHMSEYESAAMWGIYSRGGYGIALRSTFGRLINAICDRREVYMGKVAYEDYCSFQMAVGNIFIPFLNKRRSFEHERELRAIYNRLNIIDQVDWRARANELPPGEKIKVDLDVLVEAVIVDPAAEPWVVGVVKSIGRQYGLKVEPVQSDLMVGPA